MNFIERAVIANTSYFKNIFANLQRNTWILAITMFINRSGSMVTLIIISEILAMAFMMNYVLSNSPTDRLEQYSSLYSIAFGISIIATPLIGLGIA